MIGAPETRPTGQTYRERTPIEALRHHVTCVWLQHVPPGGATYEHRTVPNGSVELSCEIGSVPWVAGPQTGPTGEALAAGTTIVGVRFRPGAAPPLLGLPVSELVDLSVGLDALWGAAAASRIGERLAATRSAEEAAHALEQEVLARAAEGAALDPIVAEAVRRLLPGRADDVAGLPSALYISERQLRRRCLAAIGLAPKTVQRLLRFQLFLALAHARGLHDADLAQLAADVGYADQSHLTRESRRLSGQSPRALLRQAEEQCLGAHDHRASYAPLLRA